MEPYSPGAYFFKKTHVNILYNVFEKLRFPALNRFSNVNRNCYILAGKYFAFFRKYLESLEESERHKKILEKDCFKVVSTVIKDYGISTNKLAIDKTRFFVYGSQKIRGDIHRESRAYIASVDQISMTNLKDKQLLIRLPPQFDSFINKVIPYGDHLYIAYQHSDHRNNEKSEIHIMTRKVTKRKFSKKDKSTFELKYKIDLPSVGEVLEVNEGEIFTDLEPGIIGVYNRLNAKLITKMDCKAHGNDIAGIKIDGKSLYVRLTHGIINIFDLKSKELINSIQGPDCKASQEHFEIKENYLYTAEKFTLTKWKIPIGKEDKEMTKDDQIHFVDEDRNNLSSNPGIDFQIDGTTLYLKSSNSVMAFDCKTFEHLNKVEIINEKNSKWHIEQICINEGVLISILNSGPLHMFMRQCVITDLNQFRKITHQVPVQGAAKTNKFRSKIFPHN